MSSTPRLHDQFILLLVRLSITSCYLLLIGAVTRCKIKCQNIAPYHNVRAKTSPSHCILTNFQSSKREASVIRAGKFQTGDVALQRFVAQLMYVTRDQPTRDFPFLVARGALCFMGLIVRCSFDVVGLLTIFPRAPYFPAISGWGRGRHISLYCCVIGLENFSPRMSDTPLRRNLDFKIGV